MRVVSNTSPISNLAIIDRLDLLRRRYGRVLIPAEVRAELAALSHPNARQRIDKALAEGWLVVEKAGEGLPAELALDLGETAAIALARQSSADVLLMDERRGREAARRLGLTVAGVLGELVHAKSVKWIPSVRDEIVRLRREAGFFVSADVEQFILAEAGE